MLVLHHTSCWVVYFSQVEGNGSCLYASIRRVLSVPQEYTNKHMRHEVAFYLATHMDLHQNDIIPLIQGIYSTGDPNTHPQSVCSYLQELLHQNFLADEIVLRVISLLFNVTITVTRAESATQTRVRHDRDLANVDIVLLLTQSGHYSPAGKLLVLFPIIYQ